MILNRLVDLGENILLWLDVLGIFWAMIVAGPGHM
jgi:hypothetical protein